MCVTTNKIECRSRFDTIFRLVSPNERDNVASVFKPIRRKRDNTVQHCTLELRYESQNNEVFIALIRLLSLNCRKKIQRKLRESTARLDF